MRWISRWMAVALLAGCTPASSDSRGAALGGGSPDGGAGSGEGTLCEPSWSAPLRFATGDEALVGELRVTADASGVRFELESHDDEVRIGDAYVGIGPFGALSWYAGNTQPPASSIR